MRTKKIILQILILKKGLSYDMPLNYTISIILFPQTALRSPDKSQDR